MTEFWEEAFKNKQEMWGLEPAKSLAAARILSCGQVLQTGNKEQTNSTLKSIEFK